MGWTSYGVSVDEFFDKEFNSMCVDEYLAKISKYFQTISIDK